MAASESSFKTDLGNGVTKNTFARRETLAKLNAYLMFNGDCKEAMEFYKNCFGGKLDVMTISQSPMAAQYSADA
jgi:hypothetical protein